MDRNLILIISVAVSLILLTVLLVFQDVVLFISILILVVIFTLLPYSFIRFLEFRRIKSAEREFPKFLGRKKVLNVAARHIDVCYILYIPRYRNSGH